MRIASAIVVAFATIALCVRVGAADLQVDAAKQAASSFSRCMQYAGDRVGLRKWLSESGLKQAPDNLARMYLDGRSGQVFGGTAVSGEIALGSQDDGGCTEYVDHADSKTLIASFEEWLKRAGLAYSSHDTARKEAGGTMTSRAYEIASSTRKWRAVISTMPPGGAVRGDYDGVCAADSQTVMRGLAASSHFRLISA